MSVYETTIGTAATAADGGRKINLATERNNGPKKW